jgi:hypothetical protein
MSTHPITAPPPLRASLFLSSAAALFPSELAESPPGGSHSLALQVLSFSLDMLLSKGFLSFCLAPQGCTDAVLAPLIRSAPFPRNHLPPESAGPRVLSPGISEAIGPLTNPRRTVPLLRQPTQDDSPESYLLPCIFGNLFARLLLLSQTMTKHIPVPARHM